MAKGIFNKVAQRVIQGQTRCRKSSTYNRFSTTTDHQYALMDRGLSGNNTLWAKPPTVSFFKEPVEPFVENENDEMRKEILSTNHEMDLSKINHHQMIDTHALVKLLLENGFTTSQAEALTHVIVSIINDNTDTLQSSMVSKPQAELTLQKIAGQLAILRRDLMIMEKTDFTELVTKNERISYELEQVQSTMRDEINRVAGNLTLDLNLEKGKVKDMHIDHLKAVDSKHAVIFEKITALDKEIQIVRSYINTENASLQTTFERYKSDTIKLAFGSVATCMTIVLGFYRLWS